MTRRHAYVKRDGKPNSIFVRVDAPDVWFAVMDGHKVRGMFRRRYDAENFASANGDKISELDVVELQWADV